MFGEKLVIISDSLRCAGMPDGDYVLGGQPITVKNGKATLTGTDTLAGSSVSLLDCVRNAAKFGIPLANAVYAASTAPALAAGLTEVGTLAVGKAADIIVLDENLNLKAVFVSGRKQ
jgi:N-acetylglucosamine-6-phosphate deacetylase